MYDEIIKFGQNVKQAIRVCKVPGHPVRGEQRYKSPNTGKINI